MSSSYSIMASILRHRTYILIVIALMLMVLCTIIMSFFSPAYPFNAPRTYVVDPVPTRRDLARKILKIQREIEGEAGFDNKADAAWAEALLAIAAELDPRITTYKEERHSFESRMNDGSLLVNKKTWNVCPEVYKGREFDLESEHNFQEVQCNTKKFKEVVTIVISTKGWDVERIKFVVTQIRKHYDVNIVILSFGESYLNFVIDGVSIKYHDAGVLESVALNEAVSLITTPYIFLGHSLIHFNAESPLERLVRVLENLNEVSVASGAYRDISGYWRHGCLQTTLENYYLQYTRGYEYSFHECMYCDDVLGPFVAETDLLKRVTFTENMEDAAMLHDWFLSVRSSGRLVMSCPDVMFFAKAEPSMTNSDWLTIAQKWSLQRIQSYDGKEFEYSCEDAQIACVNIMKTVSSFLLPPCCRMQIRKELGFVQECAEELGLHYELQAGSLLGAVKMDGILPWDFDTDVITDCRDHRTWLTKGFECVKQKGCSPKLQFGHYWTASCVLSIVDISCRYNRTLHLPSDIQHIATQIELDGRWTKVVSNPGRITRNKYGPEYLKHAVHWRYSSNSTVPKDDGQGQVPGMWSKCAEPAFHSCLDHFPVDGNIRFKDPVCRHQ
ncbi:hypothetical protein SK128_020502 [Halocaridina rubra]|uniref:LicD/FKTN/FKRP nucleotidyltransferase domain-containing protein n=1 Tax=Halocaridina rubra TaxID=373956 RepID=A0AAN8XLS7_HALRR